MTETTGILHASASSSTTASTSSSPSSDPSQHVEQQDQKPFYMKQHINYIIKLSSKALGKHKSSESESTATATATPPPSSSVPSNTSTSTSTTTPNGASASSSTTTTATYTPSSSSSIVGNTRVDATTEDSLESIMSQHLRMSGIYWCTTSLAMMNQLDLIPKQYILPYIMMSYKHNYKDDTDNAAQANDNSVDITSEYYSMDGWGGDIDDDVHILYTTSAIQVLALYNELHTFPYRITLIRSILKLYNTHDGSWSGDHIYREVDTRFTYCAILCLALLQALPSAHNQYDETYITINQLKHTLQWLSECHNYDGGYGAVPGAESHAGQIFTCVAAKTIIYTHIEEKLFGGDGMNESRGSALLNQGMLNLHIASNDVLCSWLCDRQIDYGVTNQYTGGLNGRPEKLVDVCYSFWVLASLACMKRKDWIDRDALIKFILRCQDIDIIANNHETSSSSSTHIEGGGISDRPNNQSDPFHTFFGIAALSLLDYNDKRVNSISQTSDKSSTSLLQPISPQYALPMYVVERMNLPHGHLTRD